MDYWDTARCRIRFMRAADDASGVVGRVPLGCSVLPDRRSIEHPLECHSQENR